MLRLLAVGGEVMLVCVLVAVDTVPLPVIVAEGKSILRLDAGRLPLKAELESLGGVDYPLTDGRVLEVDHASNSVAGLVDDVDSPVQIPTFDVEAADCDAYVRDCCGMKEGCP